MTSTADLLQLAATHMMPVYAPPPFVVQRGEGARLWDTDGREYLDFASGIGVNALGHCHPHVVEAITRQAREVCHTSNSFYQPAYIALCARLGQLAFGPRVYLSNSGAEATEAALKLARRTFADRGEDRTEFVATLNGFHGRTLGALSVTGQETYRKGFSPLVPGVSFVPFDDLPAMERAVGPRTAAVIVEPIQGNGGVRVPTPGYLRDLKALCETRGCLLILDEVQTGIGRTGKWFAYEHEGMVPDILCLAKAMGGGMPVGAMITTEALAQAFQPGVHGTTFGGNPVACAAGLATLDVIEREGLLERATRMGERYRALLGDLQRRRPALQELRGRGLLVGLAFPKPVKELQGACRKAGLLTTAAGSQVLRLFPPLNVTEACLVRSVEALDVAIQQVYG
jgi:acetylornithine/N-succinyldiaminopimelate aminotransferase